MAHCGRMTKRLVNRIDEVNKRFGVGVRTIHQTEVVRLSVRPTEALSTGRSNHPSCHRIDTAGTPASTSPLFDIRSLVVSTDWGVRRNGRCLIFLRIPIFSEQRHALIPLQDAKLDFVGLEPAYQKIEGGT
jgi:hypothetical protein